MAPPAGQLQAPSGRAVPRDLPKGKHHFVELQSASTEAVPQNWEISNGIPVDPKDWPATVISQPSGCTATFVGPQALLTAAHCVQDNQEVMAYIAGKTRYATCHQASRYSAQYDQTQTLDNWDRTSADYAICIVNKEDTVTGVPFEVVGAGPLLVHNAQIRLLGFGCNGTTDKSDGYEFLRTAGARVTTLPSLAQSGNNYILTDWTNGGYQGAKGGALCPGDSGGSVFWPLGDGTRRIVGLNSRTQTVSKTDRTLTGVSYLSSTLTSDGYSFLKQWGDIAAICGINAGATGCRQ